MLVTVLVEGSLSAGERGSLRYLHGVRNLAMGLVSAAGAAVNGPGSAWCRSVNTGGG